MAEYIDKEAVIKAVSENDYEGYATRAVKSIPAADVREKVKARWEWIEAGDESCYYCTNCGEHNFYQARFCPDCGAQMGGAEDDMGRDPDKFFFNEPETNADRIRAMSDEELAKTLWDYADGCPAGYAWSEACVMPDDCEGCWLDWLKSPVEVDG